MNNERPTRPGDVFTFVARVDGKPKELTGRVVRVLPSQLARKLGYTHSTRRRRGLLLKVQGIDKLFFKDKGQVRGVTTTVQEAKDKLNN